MSRNSKWEEVGSRISYDKTKLLGKGGFARVYDGMYKYFDGMGTFSTRVAVKKLYTDDAEVLKKEIAIHGKLQHEHVIKLLFHDRDDESHYLVLEKAICSLKDFMEGKKNNVGIQLSTEAILEQTTLGLEHIHSMDIIHRDVKLSNYLICVYQREAVIKIADFGISKNLDPDKTSCTNSRTGTEGYRACEILRNLRASKGSDVFSLGIVFFKVFQPNHHPFGDNDIDIAVNIRDREDPDLQLLDYDDAMYNQLIESMISHESADRPSATQIAAYLHLFGSGSDWEGSNISRKFMRAYIVEMIKRQKTKCKRVPGNSR